MRHRVSALVCGCTRVCVGGGGSMCAKCPLTHMCTGMVHAPKGARLAAKHHLARRILAFPPSLQVLRTQSCMGGRCLAALMRILATWHEQCFDVTRRLKVCLYVVLSGSWDQGGVWCGGGAADPQALRAPSGGCVGTGWCRARTRVGLPAAAASPGVKRRCGMCAKEESRLLTHWLRAPAGRQAHPERRAADEAGLLGVRPASPPGAARKRKGAGPGSVRGQAWGRERGHVWVPPVVTSPTQVVTSPGRHPMGLSAPTWPL
jgi:hypothetical protein